jgi:GT2 family glycosyltransferase
MSDATSVIVVSHNAATDLPECLRTLRAEQPLQTVLVDNASWDGSADRVRRDFPEVEVLVNHRNVGYARAVNQAARRCQGRYLLVLNADVLVHPGAVATLQAHLDEQPGVGVVAPGLLHPDGSRQLSCRRHYTWGTYLLRRAPLRWWFPDHPVVRHHLMADWDHASIREVDWVLGAALMLRREALGPEILDERYFLYFEDVDLCLGLERAGWKVIYHPGAVMTHRHRRASGRGLLNRGKYHHFRSWLRFLWKHRGAGPVS